MVFTEQTGLEKLYNMVAYAFDLSKCRRVLIARHFGEQFDSAQCKEMCDHCDTKNSGNILKKDITKYCKDILALLDHARSTQQRVTGLKVVDAWLGKGATTLRLSSVKAPQLQRSDCERVLLYMLIHNYIREDFHFTAYSTISYLVSGPRAQLLAASSKAIEIELPGPAKRVALTKSATAPAATGTKSATASAATSSKSASTGKNDKPRPKLSIVNPHKSAFTTSSMLTAGYQPQNGESQDNEDKGDSTAAAENGAEIVKVVTKKRPAIESDGDSDLDFCDDVPVKRAKKSALLNSRRKKSFFDDECIVLQSDSDDDSSVEGNSENKRTNKVKGQSSMRENSKLSKFADNPSNSSSEVQNGIIDSD